jgi:CheY-like chemotaxis protein
MEYGGGAMGRQIVAQAKPLEYAHARPARHALPRVSAHVRMPDDDPLAYFELQIRIAANLYRRVRKKGPSILWVDDFPQNNSALAELLKKAGCDVVRATSTKEAMRALGDDVYALVITDMGRGANPKAGLDFIQQASVRERRIPTIVFASMRAIGNHGRSARRKGAVLCTAGFVTLLHGVGQVLDWWVRRPE